MKQKLTHVLKIGKKTIRVRPLYSHDEEGKLLCVEPSTRYTNKTGIHVIAWVRIEKLRSL